MKKEQAFTNKKKKDEKMSRQEMIKKAVEIAESDMQNIGYTKEELIKEVNKLTNEELKNYIED